MTPIRGGFGAPGPLDQTSPGQASGEVPNTNVPPEGLHPRRNSQDKALPQGNLRRRNAILGHARTNPHLPPDGKDPGRNGTAAQPAVGMPQPQAMQAPPAPPRTESANPDLPKPGQQPRRNRGAATRPMPQPMQMPTPMGAQMHMPMPQPPVIQGGHPWQPPPVMQHPPQAFAMPNVAAYQPAAPQPQLDPGIAFHYRHFNLNITQDTVPAYTNANLVSQPKQLGSGKYNTVFAVQLSRPDGTRFDGVFKPLNTSEYGGAAESSGIPRDNPQTAMRNIATVAYASRLGFDVIPDTRVAMLQTPADQGPRLGLVMDRAVGQAGWDTRFETLSRPDVMREVTKLQVLDHLTAQGDRHSLNYFIDVKTDGSVKVCGIDNDQCFGANVTRPGDIRRADESSMFWGTGLPPVVDRDIANQVWNLSHADVSAMLGDKLSPAEVDAAKQRLDGMKQHIAELHMKGCVIDPSQWGLARHLFTPANSYIGREFETSMGREW